MRSAQLICAVFAISTLAACGGGGTPAPPSGGSGDAGTITGKERIGWDQQAATTDDLASIRYAIYIDGNRVELSAVSCTQTAATNGFPCSAPLPSMAPGKHTLELASFTVGGSESAKSAPLSVTVSPASTASALTASAPIDPKKRRPNLKTRDGVTLRVDAIADGVSDPSSIGLAPDGRVFVAERAGQVRTIRDGQLDSTAALQVQDLFVDGDRGGVLSLAVDPAFEQTRFVYVLDVTTTDNGPAFRLSRFREAGGILGERAVLLDRVTASPDRPAGSIAFGPDGKLYVALDDGGERERAAMPASLNGKVLRLNPDGTTPDDQPGASPVYSMNYSSPGDLDWDAAAATLWLADWRRQETDRLRATRSSAGRDPERQPFKFPLPSGPSSLAMVRGSTVPALDRNLFVASGDDGTVLRVRLAEGSRDVVSTESLTIDGSARVRALEAGADGVLYVALDREILKVSPTLSSERTEIRSRR